MKRVMLLGVLFWLAISIQEARAEGDPPPTAGTFMDGWTYVNELWDGHEGIGLIYGNVETINNGGIWWGGVSVARNNVWESHPASTGLPFKWLRTVTIQNGVNAGLHFEITSGGPFLGGQIPDFRLVVVANGQNLVDRIIDGTQWYSIDVDLSQFNGQTVNLELWNANGGRDWWYELAFWSNLYFTAGGGGGGGGGGGVTGPTITTQPANVTITAGQTATFNVAATGTGTLSYQWQMNGANIQGATSASYSTSTATNGSTFDCIVTDSKGSVTSNTVTLTVNPSPPAGGGLPAGWGQVDIGPPDIPGSASYDGTTWTISGDGSDIWAPHDRFHYVYCQISGDETITAHVASLSDSGQPWAKAGVMFRQNINVNDGSGGGHCPFIMACGTFSNGTTMEWRDTDGEPAATGPLYSTELARVYRSGCVCSARAMCSRPIIPRMAIRGPNCLAAPILLF